MQIESKDRRKAAAGSARVAVIAVLLIQAIGLAHGQTMQPYQEYDKRLRSAEQVGALTSDLFGDSVNVYDQSVAFQQTDIDIPGTNALPVRLTRKLAVRPLPATIAAQPYGGAGDWDIDVPYISGVFDSAYGWNTGSGGQAQARCSETFYPRTTPPHQIEDIWSGYSVNLPGEGARSLIGLPPSSFKPANGQGNVWTTSSLDAISCTPMLSGYPGEGFVVQTTDGITYTFNVGTTRNVGAMGQDGAVGKSRPRVEVYLLASRIEDRFGNSVTFSYNAAGHPTAITGSDGRSITLQYANGRLASAASYGRSWTYAYTPAALLQRITQPDAATWEITHLTERRISYEIWREDPGPGCGNVAPLREQTFSLQMKHPSSAVATFRFDHQRRYRNGVPAVLCVAESSGGMGATILHRLAVPNYFDVYGLTEKTIEGPGIPSPLRWFYEDVSGGGELWSGNVPPCTTCVASKAVTIHQPDGSRVTESYGVVYSLNEGKLLARSVAAASGAVLESQNLTYVSTAQVSGMPFPDRYGSRWGGNDESSVLVRPLLKKEVVRDGVTMTWSVNTFDAKGRPLQVSRGSSLGDSRTDTTTYYDDASRWVLGQTASTTNNNTGLVESQTSFNALALPEQQRQFGKVTQTLTYHADGSLASAADGRGNLTTLNNWKRGTPQSIGFPDGTSISATVNDNGWITNVVNELGYQTSYGYDAMGRMSTTTYPSGDTNEWNAMVQKFERVTAVEHGIAAGHWRLTTTSGNRRKLTYFDAMWRPLVTREHDTSNITATDRYQRFSYDHAGRAIFQSYPGSTATLTAGNWIEYDALGRLTSSSGDSELGLLTTMTEYLPGMDVRMTTPRGDRSITHHQVFDTPSYQSPISIEQPAASEPGIRTRVVRDVLGKPTRIVRESF
ncbi:RHS repeat domain-containing protein [Stenotrophomonas lacuserhaii]|uniref:RHS repeat domain-containing protein n=1 Tax=Stenotrophomonas lacuserhaii TaxID=2760084 RepID=UPI0032ED2EFC